METVQGIVFDIQRYSVQDGPGIRTTVFLKGCPLRCLWCHSPESQSPKPQIAISKMSCLGYDLCAECMAACPKAELGAIKAVDFVKADPEAEGGERHLTIPQIDTDVCDSCGLCAEACPPEGLEICGKRRGVEEVIKLVLKDRSYYEKSGGGMTVSGGEPLSQHTYAHALLAAAKAEGLNTALDTTGYAKWETIEQMLPVCDTFLYDMKHIDSAPHKQATGVPNELILENLQKLAQACRDLAELDAPLQPKIQIRIPTIPQFNDDEATQERMADFIKQLGSAVSMVQLLPYHALGAAKYEKIFWKQTIFEAPVPSDAKMQGLARIYAGKGIPVGIH
ncbi:MAG: glycyl-radical enzyme activating protein [Coriobacteriales bacterium]|jgi:pyruvate formate lyase activating enzyme|nr:glycyl-radical enzyme activating protein [Coriobacteriales bacterium]